MSSELANNFAEKHHEKYAAVVETWADKAVGEKITDNLAEKWGADLHEALAEDLLESLTAEDPFSKWKGQLTLPSKETLVRFSQIAVKYSLQYATTDLLKRLIRSADWNRANPPDSITAAAIRPMRPAELAARSPQTVAQIFDMTKDKLNNTLNNFFSRKNQFTGRRKWVTESKNSRHAALNGEIKGPDEYFVFKKEKIAAPRPVGGSPASWSNCSCQLSYELKNGNWIIP